MNMRITNEQLCAYLDGELDANEHAQAERAVQQDAALASKLSEWTNQTAHLRDAMQPEFDEALPQAWLRLARKPAAPARTSLRERLLQWMPAPRYAAGMAVAVLVGIFVGKRLTVFVRTEGAANRSTQLQCDTYRGVSVCYWYAGGVAYALAGEVPPANLAARAAPAAVSARP
jgi:anti-sigma factor RsiW